VTRLHVWDFQAELVNSVSKRELSPSALPNAILCGSAWRSLVLGFAFDNLSIDMRGEVFIAISPSAESSLYNHTRINAITMIIQSIFNVSLLFFNTTVVALQ
jgi:hypothetical protein